MTPKSNPEFAAFIGIDWADAKHDICLQAAGSSKREFAVLSHRPDAIDEWAATLRQRFSGQAGGCLPGDRSWTTGLRTAEA